MALLRELVDELRALRATVEANSGNIATAINARSGPAAAGDARLLVALARTFGRQVFSVADLQRCRDAEVAALVDGLSARQLGATLRRLRRRPVAGFAVVRVARDGSGAVWAVGVA